ncbi:hypothetical protein EIP91_001987, partial [Steccherinum ochraceum]
MTGGSIKGTTKRPPAAALSARWIMAGLDDLLHRRPPTAWDHFTSSPLLFLARSLYAPTLSVSAISASTTPPIRLVCISDTHNTHHAQPPLPDGDVLIHAGDLTQSGSASELDDALTWLAAHPHPHKVFIAGNHDRALAAAPEDVRIQAGLTYLEDTDVELTVRGRTLRIYGSPHTPRHGSWPFQYPRVRPASYDDLSISGEAHAVWSRIPPTTDVLVTHGPPFAHLDLDRFGCYALLAAL